ncbi:MAG: hypothetical protein AB1451_04320 [Nitrospirota bacterium]
MIDLQVDRSWEEHQLVTSLLIAFCFWLVAFVGYLSFSDRSNEREMRTVVTVDHRTGAAVVALCVGLAWVFLLSTVFAGEGFRPFLGNQQNEARFGAGHFFILQDLYMYAFVAYAGAMSSQRPSGSMGLSFKVTVVAIVATALIMTIAASSRRHASTAIFVLVCLFLLRRRRGGALAILAIVGTIFAAPLLDAFRYIDISQVDGSLLSIANVFSPVLEARRFWTSLSSSFEGVDHLGAFMETAGMGGLLIGVDGGVAWSFNTVLALVPRFLWESKPELYGSVAEQFYLYPWMYSSGPATTTLPPSFVVDLSYGFGIIVGLMLAFILGRALRVLSVQLWSLNRNVAVRAIPLFVFVNTFNVVRGGTGFLQSVVIFVIVACFVIGFRPMGGEVARLVRLVVLPMRARERK